MKDKFSSTVQTSALFNNPAMKGNRGLFIVTNITNLMGFRFVHKIICVLSSTSIMISIKFDFLNSSCSTFIYFS